MLFGETIVISAIIVFCYMTALFIVAMAAGDNSIADIAWGPGFIIVALAAILREGEPGARQAVVAVMVTIWGLRLAIRIFRRNYGRGEDPRYRKWREEWGRLFVLRSYLQVFLLQGAILLLNALPLMIIASSGEKGIGWSDALGIAIWCVGFLFEALGDHQLDRFVKDPSNRGTILRTGLWRYSRHPNYFGEAALWWGIGVIALSSSWGWIGLIGPMVITAMLLFVSGVPMTERMMEGTPGWEEYRSATSAFIPWFPKK
ncbi:MAG: DUF1295 domain-containing protein [Spirochaetes bacterium]|nr:DUF1295 domain-containing protein [Spirochaetota bacterium]